MHNDEKIMFSRAPSSTPDTKELRGDAPTELVCALDALALVDDITRHAYCLRVLTAHVEKEIHRHTVLANVLKGNPLLVASSRSRSE